MVEKQTKKLFLKKATYRASRLLEMVHGDICGPITPSTQAATVHATVLVTVVATVPGQNPLQATTVHIPLNSPQTPATGTDEDDYKEDDVAIPEPRNYNEAKLKPQWLKAMKTELESIVKNNTWKLVPLPKGVVPIGLKWLFKIKRNVNGLIMKYKAQLVAKGYVQQPWIDLDKVFASVARLETIRLLIALAAGKGWKIYHLDVKTAFLHGELKEEVYVIQPEGFEKPREEKKVYKLAKSLYGLRQAPKAWNIKIDNTLKEILTYYLGIKVSQGKDCVEIKQERYARKILKEAGMEDCNATSYPMEKDLKLSKAKDGPEVEATQYQKVVGCLRYLLHTHPNLTYSVGVVSRYMQSPRESHARAIKQILHYLKGTTLFGIKYIHSNDMKLVGYSVSSHNVDLDDGRSTTGHLKELLAEGTRLERQKVIIRVDNKSAIALSKNPVFYGRSKHIHTRYHFIRECVENEQVIVEHVSEENQRVDPLTKALACIRFKDMRSLLGVQELPSSTQKFRGLNLFLMMLVGITLATINGGKLVADACKLLDTPEIPKPILPDIPKPQVPVIPKPKVPEVLKPTLPEIPKPEIPELSKLTLPEVPKPEVPVLPKPTLLEVPKPEVHVIPKPQVPEVLKPILPEITKPTLPEVPKPEVPVLPKHEVPELQKPTLPEVPKPTIPEIPKPTNPEIPKPTVPEVPKLTLPEFTKPELPTLPKPKVELGHNLKLRLSDSNSLTAVSSWNFNSQDFPHRQPIYKEAVSSHLVLDCAFGGVRILMVQNLKQDLETHLDITNTDMKDASDPNDSETTSQRIMILLPIAITARRTHIKDSLQQGIASGAKEVNTTIKKSSRPERASVFAKRAPGRNLLPHQKPTPLRKVFSTFKKGIYCHINVDVGLEITRCNAVWFEWSGMIGVDKGTGVEVSEGNISIFDTGLGMDDTNIENGDMGVLLHQTSGSVRDPSGDELELSPGGSFTKCDDLSEGKTIMPIEFQVSLGLTLYSSIESLLHVNGEDLAEIPSGEGQDHLMRRMHALGVCIFLLKRGRRPLVDITFYNKDYLLD
ncbi:ribonuclease H-like domain, reverse transcriptase, RNA-dependent DNA polymerase [Tanacetum coccineum]